MNEPASVQVFGTRGDAGVRKALRFFQERRVQVHFVDFRRRGPAKGELRRFFDRFGADAMIDWNSKRSRALGLHVVHYGYSRWLEVACEEPLILRLPLVRHGDRLTVGVDEEAWKKWLEDRGP